MHFILFNGAPRVGKDTAARFAYERLADRLEYLVNWEKFSFPIKRAFAGMMNLPIDEWGTVMPYEQIKDEPIPVLGGISYRRWQIDFSEDFMKPCYGEDIFGRLLLDRCQHKKENPFKQFIIVSDCGFQVECNTLAEYPTMLITIEREGFTYENDSRGPLFPSSPNWTHHTIYNRGSLEGLRATITTLVDEFLQKVGAAQ